MNAPRIALILAGLMVAPVHAYHNGSASGTSLHPACHLLTESECRSHLAKLLEFGDDAARNAYLAAHAALIKERESLCGSGREMRSVLAVSER